MQSDAIATHLTADDLEYVIAGEDYHLFPNTLTTVCCLTLRNGFAVVGEATAADPEAFRPEKGRQMARRKAVSKVFMLEGYLLRERTTANSESERGNE